MFGWLFGKKEVDVLKEDTKRGFESVKDIINGTFVLRKYLIRCRNDYDLINFHNYLKQSELSKIISNKPNYLYNIFNNLLKNKPSEQAMFDQVRMMRYKIRPLQGDVSMLDFKNKKLTRNSFVFSYFS